MIRTILLFILVMLVFQSLRVVFRSAARASRGQRERKRVHGDEMVLDPECRTYVVKDRAVVRGSGENRSYFCSDECARKYEARRRG